MYLIIGGSGVLGTYLARYLGETGEGVRVFDSQRSPGLPAGAEVVYGGLCDIRSLVAAMRGTQAVFHLAAMMPQARGPSEVLRGSVVGGTANAVRAAVEAGASRFVFCSSAEVYGYPSQMPAHEDDSKRPVTAYGRFMLEAEDCCRRAWRGDGLETVILRPSILVGPGLTDRFLLLLVSSMARNRPIAYVGDGHNRFQMTAVEDCVLACWRAATIPGVGGEAFNIGSADPLPVVEQAEQVRLRTGTRSALWRVPQEPTATVLRCLGRLRLMPLQPEYIPFLYRDFVMDIAKAQRRLGWRPRLTNVDMLARAYDWYVKAHRRPVGADRASG
ncbi:MAG: NAD-dependent epimerase/dehydratase family protein [Candidatus Binatia bacterium]